VVLRKININMAAKRRKKHKNKISGLVISMCYNEQKSKFSLFTNPSILEKDRSGEVEKVGGYEIRISECGIRKEKRGKAIRFRSSECGILQDVGKMCWQWDSELGIRPPASSSCRLYPLSEL
jgi:hypothetical protein